MFTKVNNLEELNEIQACNYKVSVRSDDKAIIFNRNDDNDDYTTTLGLGWIDKSGSLNLHTQLLYSAHRVHGALQRFLKSDDNSSITTITLNACKNGHFTLTCNDIDNTEPTIENTYTNFDNLLIGIQSLYTCNKEL
ncbi:hypothetical protein L1267_12355 [Pseudoalteromonas sp. OFAV1]|uniref:hypothetical protein n=1 Tax=Pseudoalteromonas sp. OFAV1 TaxID=2908892 RepID=UPI001F3E06AF|nr:hypothetical protein [Pseudoalteromonas sp. OFAV1]MCF2901184.1 hypothetical protein [Pseudoalteromonas sp. OFAV1]